MLRFVRGLLALVLGSVMWGAAAAPAHADPSAVTVSSVPGVIFEDCAEHPFTYAVDPPVDAAMWAITLVLQAPDGTPAGQVMAIKGSPTQGVVTERFCASTHMPGTYSVTGVYEVITSKSIIKTEIAPFTFDMRMALSTVKAKASDKTPKLGQRVKVKVRATDERPSGDFFGTGGLTVQLQRHQGSRWVKVGGTKGFTNSAGKVVLRFRHVWKGKSSFRVVTRHEVLGNLRSRAFTLRSHR